MGKHDRIAVLGMLVLSFSSDVWRDREGKGGKEKERERQTERREKREWVKGVTAAPYEKNKEN